MPINDQSVVRANRDTLYSAAIFDLDASPVTITLPDAGKRFMSMQLINEDEYTPVVYYGKGSYTLTIAWLPRSQTIYKDGSGRLHIFAMNAIGPFIEVTLPAGLSSVKAMGFVDTNNDGVLDLSQFDKVRESSLPSQSILC